MHSLEFVTQKVVVEQAQEQMRNADQVRFSKSRRVEYGASPHPYRVAIRFRHFAIGLLVVFLLMLGIGQWLAASTISVAHLLVWFA